MKKRISLLILCVLIVFNSLSVFGATLTGFTVPDFETYAKSAGYDLSNYPYYYIQGRASGGYIITTCYFETSPHILIENADTSGGSWSTSVYYGYITCDNFVRVEVKTDTSGNYVSHNVASSGSVGTKHFYQYNDVVSLYSNHDIIKKHTNGDVSTFFIQAPFLEGHRGIIGTTISDQTLVQPIMKMIPYLVPSVIGLAIFIIALRKGYQTLLAQLRQA